MTVTRVYKCPECGNTDRTRIDDNGYPEESFDLTLLCQECTHQWDPLHEGEVSTTIAGFEVILELFVEDGAQRSFCTLSKRGQSASLALAEDWGCLNPDDEPDQRVYITNDTVDRITEWALAHGY